MEWFNSSAPHREFSNSCAHVLNMEWSNPNALYAEMSNPNTHVVNLVATLASSPNNLVNFYF